MKVSANGIELWFDIEGTAEHVVDGMVVRNPTVILIHGGPGADHRFSRSFAPALADVAQLIYIDLRGHGQSSPSSCDHWNLATWADDIAEFCRVLDIARPIILGTSFGGFVAQALATRHPSLPSGLVLCSTAARLDLDAIVSCFGRLGGRAAAVAARAFLRQPDSSSAAADYLRHCLPLYSIDAKGDAPSAIQGDNWRPEIFAWYMRPDEGEFYTADYRAALNELRIPALIVCGAQDPVTPPAAAEELHAAFAPGMAELFIISGASHTVYRDQRDRFLGAVRGFLAAHGNARPGSATATSGLGLWKDEWVG